MAYSDNIDRYPSEFPGLFHTANSGEALELICKDEKRAIRLAAELNAYRRAVEKAKSPGYLEASRTIVRRTKNILVLESRSHELQSVLKDSNISIASAPQIPSESEIDKRLAEISKGEEDER